MKSLADKSIIKAFFVGVALEQSMLSCQCLDLIDQSFQAYSLIYPPFLFFVDDSGLNCVSYNLEMKIL